MFRAIFAGAAVLALGQLAMPASAETVRDSEHNFSIAVPSGWASEKNPTEDIRLVMASPKREQTGGNCNVVTEERTQSKGLSAAQIESELDTELNDAAWLAMFKAVIFIDDVKVEKSGSERVNGLKAYYVVATFNSISPGMAVRAVKLTQYLLAIPGETFFVTCSATAESYAQEEGDFKTVFASFAPINDAVASAAPSGVPSLTLYARANFGGVSRVVTRDTPDLALYGWHDAAASMSVAGDGLWQVCDGADYGGRCRVIAHASHESLTVGSVRHLSPAQSNFAVMLQSGGTESASAAARGR